MIGQKNPSAALNGGQNALNSNIIFEEILVI